MKYSLWGDLLLQNKIIFRYGSCTCDFPTKSKWIYQPVMWCLQTNKLRFRSDKGILPFSESALWVIIIRHQHMAAATLIAYQSPEFNGQNYNPTESDFIISRASCRRPPSVGFPLSVQALSSIFSLHLWAACVCLCPTRRGDRGKYRLLLRHTLDSWHFCPTSDVCHQITGPKIHAHTENISTEVHVLITDMSLMPYKILEVWPAQTLMLDRVVLRWRTIHSWKGFFFPKLTQRLWLRKSVFLFIFIC